jgi:hypothetical protein
VFTKLFKSLLLAGGCAAFLTPAAPAASVTGYGELFAGAGYMSQSFKETYPLVCSNVIMPCSTFGHFGTYYFHDQTDLWSIGGSAHGNIAFDSDLGLQLDIAGQNRGYSTMSHSGLGIGAHVYRRDADFLYGGFFSIGDSSGGRLVTAGLEGQTYWDKVTLYTQASYSTAIQGVLQENNTDSWNLHAEARYFYTDNIVFSGGLGASLAHKNWSWDAYNYNTNNGGILQWDLRAEYLLDEGPLGLFAAYQGSNITWHQRWSYLATNKALYRNNAIMLGLRFYFGQNSLLANDRSGASLKDYNPWYGTQPDQLTANGDAPSFAVPL